MNGSSTNKQNEDYTLTDNSSTGTSSTPPPIDITLLQNETNSVALSDINKNPTTNASLPANSSDAKEEFDIEKENVGIIQNNLMPQLTENEIQKRDLKYKMVKIITGCLIAQGILLLAPMVAIIYTSFSPILKNNDNLSKNLPIILNFLKYYISAVIVETLAMLSYIIKKVFDSSITDMIELFKKNKKNKNKKDNKNNESSH